MNMSIYEYDEELHIKTMMDIGREEGYEAGVSEGINGAILIMKNMNAADEDIEISRATGLSIEEVLEIRSNLQLSC